MSEEEERLKETERRLRETEERLRHQEERLKQLENRLKRGEISEETFKEIKDRYEATPKAAEPPKEPHEPESATGFEDMGAVIEESIGKVMAEVGRKLENSFGSEEFERRMEEVGQRVREALDQIGPKVEAGGRKIIIRGAGVISSDTPIDLLRCSGSGKVTNDINASEVQISGACKFDGGCVAQEFHVSGSAAISSDLNAREFHSSGSTSVGGDLRSQEVSSSGSLRVAGSILDSQEFHSAGTLKVDHWVRTQEFVSKGNFNIGEGIEAHEVGIRLSGTSRVPIIKAHEISVHRGKRDGELRAESIEGEEVYIEATRASTVRGKRVTIGPFCTIDVVEARELEVHETSTVKEQKKLVE